MAIVPVRPRNDPAQYDDLTDEWWRPRGRFAALHWLAAARADLIPPSPAPGAPLLDIACGGGLLAPHLTGPRAGWRHVGIDLSPLSLTQARSHGISPVRADAHRLPFADGSFPCVVAGEVLEHLEDLEGVCAEIARVLAPGGTLVVDTISRTRFARIALVHVAERLPGGPPPRIHDPELFVHPRRLEELLARHGVRLTQVTGLRPAIGDYVRWLLGRTEHVRWLPQRSTAGLYQAVGEKEAS